MNTDAHTPPDLDLASRAIAGDGDAFVRLLHHYKRMIYAAIYAALGPTDHADDIAQETAVAAWRGIRTMRSPQAVPSWLWVIATRSAHHFRTRHPVTVPLPDRPTEHHKDHAGPLAEHLHVAEALRQLPEHERAIVVMHLVTDLSYREISERTGIPIGTVQSRYGRGIARLRRLLASEGSTR